jgi:peptidoglycan/xylan/chitin deacetylase (PgdA/CDA1 family)
MSTIPILCYHAVGDDTGGPLAPWAMSPPRFDEHLDALAGAGHQPVGLDDLVRWVHDGDQTVPEGAVVLTIDDGYADVADTIWPRLVERGWPATLYVTTGVAGGRFHDRPMLTPAQVHELSAAGLSIGAHGHTHVALDTVSPAVAADEVRRSRDLVEDWTGRTVTSFAYPHGFHDRRVRRLVVDAGFRHACAVKQALSSPADDRHALARIMPTGDVTGAELVDRLTSLRTPIAVGGREQLRTTAYRVVRRARQKVAA